MAGNRRRGILGWLGRYVLPVVLGVVVFCFGFNAVTAKENLDPEKAAEVKDIEGSFVTGAGVRTHYVKKGDGPETVVLIHGFGGSTYSWRKNIDYLAERFTVIAIDVRGFGFSSRDPAAEYSAKGYATHVSSFMDILGIRRPILVGHSLGGEVAMRIALQRPEDVAGLVLIDSAGLPNPERDRFREVPPIPPPFNTTLARIAGSEGMVRRILNESTYNTSMVDERSIKAYRDPLDVEDAEAGLLRMIRTSIPSLNKGEIARIVQPTLILWGSEDKVISVTEGQELARVIKGSRLVSFERAGHLLLEERPDEVNRQIADFTAQVGQPLPDQPKPITPPPGGGPQPLPGTSPTPRPTASPSPGVYLPGV